VTVRFCEYNKGKGGALRRLEEEHPGVDVEVMKCLGLCSSCAEQPVARVEGRKVAGKDGEELYRRILEALAEEEGGKEAGEGRKKALR
jgi:uncharacterized protein YuzB (UPF0349 family)